MFNLSSSPTPLPLTQKHAIFLLLSSCFIFLLPFIGKLLKTLSVLAVSTSFLLCWTQPAQAFIPSSPPSDLVNFTNDFRCCWNCQVWVHILFNHLTIITRVSSSYPVLSHSWHTSFLDFWVKTLPWFSSWLSDLCYSSYSYWSLHAGMPQGSGFFPLLRILTLTIISLSLMAVKYHLFAENCQLFFSNL